ncbi:MAG: hypothetical protein ABW007_27370 [Chitinophagaceae bacterium]
MNIFLVLLLPVGYFVFLLVQLFLQRRRMRERKQELARSYNSFVIRERMIIDHSEVIGDMVIALNRSWKELIVIDHHGKQKKMYRIRLTTVTDCTIKENRRAKGGLENIVLLLFSTTDKPPLEIFFRPADNSLIGEQAVLKIAR